LPCADGRLGMRPAHSRLALTPPRRKLPDGRASHP
jgi:hypothetical protein